MILDAIRESGGMAVAVPEGKILSYMMLAAQLEGISICPEAAACVGALEILSDEGWIKPDEKVVIFNTAAVQKYPDIVDLDFPAVDTHKPVDWEFIRRV
jgi:threonine synthase